MTIGQWYDSFVMPKLVCMACGQCPIMERREQMVPLAFGDVFELGCGGGLNQQFYKTDAVDSFCGIDPHAGLLDRARDQAAKRGWVTDIREGRGEAIPFANSKFDCVVCTFTLCSVENAGKTMAEMRRILRPGGTLIFLEHGRAPDANVFKWQSRIEPVWKHFTGGCHLTRPIGSALRGAGFDVEPHGQGYLPKTPRFAGWNEWGIARKAGA